MCAMRGIENAVSGRSVSARAKEYLIFSLIFAFLCFLGGLAGVVIRGFYVLYKK